MDSKTKFLEAAAAMYKEQSPAISAHLMTDARDIRDLDATRSKGSTLKSCAACGTILIPGSTESLSLRSSRPPFEKHQGKKGKEGAVRQPCETTTLVSTCSVCGRFSQHVLPKRRPSHSLSKTRTATQPSVQGDEHSTTVNATKKKRRKKAAGLQAMLAKSDAANKSANPGLDFMDLMQTPANKQAH